MNARSSSGAEIENICGSLWVRSHTDLNMLYIYILSSNFTGSVCLRHVSCVPNVAMASALTILGCPLHMYTYLGFIKAVNFKTLFFNFI